MSSHKEKDLKNKQGKAEKAQKSAKKDAEKQFKKDQKAVKESKKRKEKAEKKLVIQAPKKEIKGPHIIIDIPGGKKLTLAHLVLDYNGTLAKDGKPVWGVKKRIMKLAEMMTVHIITADTLGSVKRMTGHWPCSLTIIGKDNQDKEKASYIKKLDEEICAAIGNGRNDRPMVEKAALGIAVIGTEGASGKTVNEADIVCTNINDALDLLIHHARLQATLRN